MFEKEIPMASQLLTYLQGISGNAAALKQFHTDPATAARNAHLSPGETAALLTRNPGAISAAIRAGGGVSASDDINVTIVVVVAP